MYCCYKGSPVVWKLALSWHILFLQLPPQKLYNISNATTLYECVCAKAPNRKSPAGTAWQTKNFKHNYWQLLGVELLVLYVLTLIVYPLSLAQCYTVFIGFSYQIKTLTILNHYMLY